MPIHRHAILVVSGDDRPGVLDDVSLFLHEHHASILESRVSLLRGQFALLLLVQAPEESLASIELGLPELTRTAGVRLELRKASERESRDCTSVCLTARGQDAANLLHRVSHLMRVLNVNIDNIETHATDTAGLSELEMQLSVPRATPLMMLKQFVEGLAEEVGFEVDVRAE